MSSSKKSSVAESIPYDESIQGVLNATNVQEALDELAVGIPSDGSDFAFFPIWGEENGGLSNNAQEYSFGNGATGNIGITLPVDAQLFAVSYQADTAGTNTEVAVTQNSTNVATTGPQSTKSGFVSLGIPVAFAAGDIVGFRTVVAGGAVDVRPCAWFRVPINDLVDLGLNDLNDVEINSPILNQVLTYDGSQWINASFSTGVTDHGALTGLADDDHLQYLTEARHDSLPFDNPHNVDKTQVGLDNVDNTSDLDKPISTDTQAALDLKYDASNPNGYETPAQLDIRDANNRNRTNHTGTQTASTISDFDTEVSNNPTVALNTAKVSADGSIDTHSDVDVTSDLPSLGDILQYDGSNFVPFELDTFQPIFGRDNDYIERTTPLDVSGSAFITYDELTINVTDNSGTNRYRFNADFLWRHDSSSNDIRVRVLLDGVDVKEIQIEPKDAGNVQRVQNNILYYANNLTAGNHTFTLQFRPAIDNRTSTIIESIIEGWRTR